MIPVSSWTPSADLTLEPNALIAASELSRNVVLTAGPGAGKTEVLAQRADFLLRTNTSPYPRRILAISFKVDASRNLWNRVKNRCGTENSYRFDSFTFHAFAKRIIDQFRLALTGSDALDADYQVGPQRIQHRSITFRDMVPLALQIVELNSLARNAIRQTYSHVLLDEFQDCTNEQYSLISACFRGTDSNLTAVGDTKQRIMGWAGALEGILETFATDFQAKKLILYQNFRSAPRLRRVQNAVVTFVEPGAAVPGSTIQGEEGIVNIGRYDDDDAEAAALAESVEKWIDVENVAPGEIAILVCKQPALYCRKLRKELTARNIACRDDDGVQDLAVEPIAALVIDFLMVMLATAEPSHLRRLLELPIFNRESENSHTHRIRWNWSNFLREAREQFENKYLRSLDRDDLAETVTSLFEYLGASTVVELSHDYSDEDRLLTLIARTIDKAHELMSKHSEPLKGLQNISSDAAVKIMSIHKSKGLEFDTVILLGIENEAFWGDEVEERAAFFVGISRAKRRLVLTVTAYREEPEGANRWRETRSEHEEFVAYAAPFVNSGE